MRRTQRGFTLLELMITVIVLVVLATLAIPSFSTLIEKSRLKGAADDVVNLISTARLEAVKQHRDVAVAIDGSATAWCVGANRAPDPATLGAPMPGATACQCSTTPSGCVLGDASAGLVATSVVNVPANSGVTTSLTSFTSGHGITFSGQLGTLVDVTVVPDTITLSSSTGRYALKISVSALGQVYACTPSGSVFISGYPSC